MRSNTLPGTRATGVPSGRPVFAATWSGERLGDHDQPALDVVEHRTRSRVERDGEVGRNGPGRRRPDERGHLAAARAPARATPVPRALAGVERELHVDRRRGVRLVLDLGLGQRRAAVDAPVHRLLALVDHALLDEPAQRAHDGGLVLGSSSSGRASSQSPRMPRRLKSVRWRPTNLSAYCAARAPELGRRSSGASSAAEFLVDLQLDRQAVAVPARHVRRVEARHASWT